jgi:hypothetical protein
MQVSPLQITGIEACVTLGFEGIHGETTAGMQGIGVNAPNFAAVAAATVGLEIVLHIPKGVILAIEAKSVIVATGITFMQTGTLGMTIRDDRTEPNEHLHNALQTAIGIK